MGTRTGTHLSHVLCNDVETAPLLDDYPQQLHQVVVPQLPLENRRATEQSDQIRSSWSSSFWENTRYVMTEASAMKA